MSLYTKCILAPTTPTDGHRISIMSRHTLNDGRTPDTRITPAHYNSHMPQFAPPPKLIGDYYRGLDWETFAQRYRAYLRIPIVRSFVESLAEQAHRENVTVLCIEATPEKCHRRLLAEECRVYRPDLAILIQ